jgi:broad specificity phosphatase PhoE
MDATLVATFVGIVLGLLTLSGYLVQVGGMKRDIEQSAKREHLKQLSERHAELAGEIRPKISLLEQRQQATEMLVTGHNIEIKALTATLEKMDAKLDRLLEGQVNR